MHDYYSGTRLQWHKQTGFCFIEVTFIVGLTIQRIDPLCEILVKIYKNLYSMFLIYVTTLIVYNFEQDFTVKASDQCNYA